jgi:antitoxin HicB
MAGLLGAAFKRWLEKHGHLSMYEERSSSGAAEAISPCSEGCQATKYPVKLTRDTNETILVTFPDVPEAITFGDDEQEALLRASDALEAALAMHVDDRRDIPEPSAVKRGMRAVSLPAVWEAKINLYRAMRQAGVTEAELARRLNCHMASRPSA